MLKQLKRLGGDSLLYAFMNVGTKIIAFVMLPIYTTFLSTEQMGIFDLLEAALAVITFLVIFGTDNALAYYFYQVTEEEKKIDYVKTVVTIRIFIASIFFISFVVFGSIFSELLLGSDKYKDMFLLLGIVLITEALITVILTYYRFIFKSKKVALLTVFKLLLVAIFSYLLLRYSNWKVESLYLGRIASGFVLLIILVRPLFKFFTLKVDFQLVKEIIKYGAPLVPASLAFWVITFSNRIILSKFTTFGDVGVYGVAVKIATMITLLTTGIQMAWRPYSMNIKDEPNAKDIYAKVYYIILGIGIVGLLAIASVSPFIVQILAPQEGYREAANYVALLSLGSFLSFYYLIISVGLFLEEKTAIVSKYVGISAGISIVLNLLLIPYFKIWGATAALVISFVFVNIFIFKKSQEVYYVPVSIRKLVGVLINGCIGILAIVMIYINDLNIIFILIPWIYVFFSFYVMGFHKMALRMVRGG